MRRARVLGDPARRGNFYHVMTRAIEGRFIFDELAKAKWRELLEAYTEFAGIRLITWCCMSNHFHLLVEVPNAETLRAGIDDEELLRRLALITEPKRLGMIASVLAELKMDSPESYQQYRGEFLARMGDLSVFMREFKQRFTQWHNRRVDRKGPLWEERFKSVLVEETQNLLLLMAGYIDLNAVRAGLVKDPKDYRWSGYGEAVVGKEKAREGLTSLYAAPGARKRPGPAGGKGKGGKDKGRQKQRNEWRECQAAYRRYLFGVGEERPLGPGQARREGKMRMGISAGRAAAVERAGGQLSAAALLRTRVRYFSDGLALGSAVYVEEVFARNREKLKVKRERGAREAPGGLLGPWRTLVDLRG